MMKKELMVRASLFTLILALMVFGTMTMAAVMKKDDGKKAVKVAVITAWELTSPTANPTLEDSYQLFTGNPEELCSGSEDVCAVMAEDRGDGLPLLTQDLKEQINKQKPAEDVYFKD